MFQNKVNEFQPTGVIGDIVVDGARRAFPGILKTPKAGLANNVIGRVLTYKGVTADGDLAVVAGGTGAFAGILANSKVYASYGTTAGGTLAPTIILPNNTSVEMVTMTSGILVYLESAADIGDQVFYRKADGTLLIPADPAKPGDTILPIPTAVVVLREIGVKGLAIIALTGVR